MNHFPLLLTLFIFVSTSALGQSDILNRSEIVHELDRIEENYQEYLDLQIRLSEIPAPPFGEDERARFILEEFRSRGLANAFIDPEGNVIGLRDGASDSALVISAHIDTVFPIETNVEVQRRDGRLYGPGIVDDALGLATMLGLIDAVNNTDLETSVDLLFVATVGEEGLGDLRGVKYLFNQSPYADNIRAFISIDGYDPGSIVTSAAASKRYRVTISGPGGHSYRTFGMVNPAHALGNVISSFTSLPVPEDPKTTYNIGRIGGGRSVNAIPDSVWMEVDMRSTSNEALSRLEDAFLSTVQLGVEAENLFRSPSNTKLDYETLLIGDRPSGSTSEEAELFKAAAWSSEALGLEVETRSASTDSNIPMSMGIPAITVGGGGTGGGFHSTSEWYDPENAYLGLQRMLLLVAAYDEMVAD